MNDDTQIIHDDAGKAGTSQIFGISIRALLACSLVWTVCIIFLFYAAANIWFTYQNDVPLSLKIEEPLYSMAVAALGFYFGQKVQQ